MTLRDLAVLLMALTAMALLLISWRLHRLDRTSWAVGLLLISGFLLRVLFASDPYLHAWDERYHALVARNMLVDPLRPVLYADPDLPYDVANWSGGHIWLHKPPLPMWSMAGSMALFGVNVYALRLPSVLLSTWLILLVHQIATGLYGRRVAWAAAALVTINGLLLELTGGHTASDHVDLFLAVFTTLGIWSALRWREQPSLKWAVVLGLATGCAVLSKWAVGLFALPVAILLWREVSDSTRAVRHLFAALGIALLIVLPWEIYTRTTFPDIVAQEQAHHLGHFTRSLDSRGRPWWFHFHMMGIIYGEAIYLPVAWWILRAQKRWARPERSALLLWLVIPYVIFSLATTKMQAYTVLCLPLVCMISAQFLAAQAVSTNKAIRWLRTPCLLLLLGMPVRILVERALPHFPTAGARGWMEVIDRFPFDHPPRTVVFGMEHPIELMFHRNVTAYAHRPTAGEIARLEARGYHVIVID